MENDQERTGGTVRSDQIDVDPEGVAEETASDAAPDVAQEAGAAEGAGATDGAGDAVASDGSDLTEKPAQKDAQVDTKKKKKKDLGIGTSRGIETMFRTSYRVQQDLVGIADAKANIMISVNGLIISIILAAVSPRIGGLPLLVLPTSILLIGCVTALVYAALAARPRVSNEPITLEKIARNEGNILFFGHFVMLSESDYQQGMRDLMENQDLLYFNMVRDLYAIGGILDKKFRLLHISYTVFMFALMVGVGLFVLVFALDATIAGDLLEPQSALPILP